MLHKNGPKQLTIRFEKENKHTLTITIEDNGIGREQSTLINSKRTHHESFATSAIESRIQLLNQTKSCKLNIEIIDLKDKEQQPSGTKVIIFISLTHEA